VDARGGQKSGFLQKYFVVVRRLAKKPGFFELMRPRLGRVEMMRSIAQLFLLMILALKHWALRTEFFTLKPLYIEWCNSQLPAKKFNCACI
jgi:hypothetical protein